MSRTGNGWTPGQLGLAVLALAEVSLLTWLGTNFALRYIKRLKLVSLRICRGADRPRLVEVFGRLAHRIRVDQICLKQALMTYALYRGSRGDVAIEFGVKKADDRILGHCWVRVAGEPLEQNDYRTIRVFS